jgi:hypothetical protein
VTVSGIIDPTGEQSRFLNISLKKAVDVFSDTKAKWQQRQESRQETGPYTLEVLDASGQVLQTQPVDPLAPSEDPTEPSALLELVPWPEGARTLVLLGEGAVELARRTASPNPPTIQVLSPVGGESLQGSILVKWQADDADNDPLAFNILYSPDGGERWQALELDLQGTQYEISLDDLPGGQAGLFRVEANDGFNTAFDDSDGTVVIPGSPPMVTIHNPREGAEQNSEGTLILDGSAEDMEEGRLRGEALVWTSDVDGTLGVGEEVFLDLSTLTPGVHQITLTATDSDGMVGMATVNMTIRPDGDK